MIPIHPSIPNRCSECDRRGPKKYRVAHRFKAGHKLRLYLTTDDQNAERPALLDFRHACVGTSSFHTVFSTSRLLLPVLRYGRNGAHGMGSSKAPHAAEI